MIGAITGDVVGSIYEWNNIKTTEFELFEGKCFFTDDTVLSVAMADAILTDRSYTQVLREYAKKYPDAGYGGRFRQWINNDDDTAYNSWGNGSAMRTSPVAYAYNTLEEVLAKSKEFAEVTHNHPEGIKGAQATASAIFLARLGNSKLEIKAYITEQFGYNLDRTLDEIRPTYKFNESCQETVPEAIIAFLESTDFESAIKLAVSLGGDSDTLACITGSIAEAFYKVPDDIADKTFRYLDESLLKVTNEFISKYNIR